MVQRGRGCKERQPRRRIQSDGLRSNGIMQLKASLQLVFSQSIASARVFRPALHRHAEAKHARYICTVGIETYDTALMLSSIARIATAVSCNNTYGSSCSTYRIRRLANLVRIGVLEKKDAIFTNFIVETEQALVAYTREFLLTVPYWKPAT